MKLAFLILVSLLLTVGCAQKNKYPKTEPNFDAKIDKCRKDLGKKNKPVGTLSAKWQVNMDGDVTGVDTTTLSKNEAAFAGFETCIRTVIKDTKYPPAANSRQYQDSFHFD